MISVRPRWPWMAAAAGYSALAIAYTWPLGARLSYVFPHDAFDPALNTWILWWNAHVVPLTPRWWNAPFFWPAPGALALSEHLLGLSIVATPLQWLGATPLAAYNVVLIASFPLAALSAHALAFAITRRHGASTVAALGYGFSLYRLSQLSHIQVLWSFGMPLSLAAAHFYLRSGRRGWLALFAAAWLIQALSNGYFLLFFPILLALWLAWHSAGQLRRAWAIAGVWAAASAALVPVLAGYRHFQTALHLRRGINEIQVFSADAMALLGTTVDSIAWRPLARFERAEGAFFPGLVVLALVALAVQRGARGGELELELERGPGWMKACRRALAIAGAVVAGIALSAVAFGPWHLGIGGWTWLSVGRADKPASVAFYLLAAASLASPRLRSLRRRGSEFAFYVLAAAVMYVLALGPYPRLGGRPILFRAPYSVLLALPGFEALRVPARLGTLWILCISMAASVGFAALTEGADRRRRFALAAAAALLITAESWPVFRLAPEPAPTAVIGRAGPRDVVVELPLGVTEQDVAAMYHSISHRRPTVNGYSGYELPHYVVLRIALARDDGDALDALAAGRPLAVAVAHGEEFARWAALVERNPRHHFVADDAQWRLFRIDPIPEPAPRGETRLPISSVTANLRGTDVRLLEDGDELTVWNAGQLQRGNESVTVDLGRERRVKLVQLDLGPYVQDFPRALTVECAGADAAWSRCWERSTAFLALRGILSDPAHAPMLIPIERDRVRWIRLRQTAVDNVNGWSIAELAVFGA